MYPLLTHGYLEPQVNTPTGISIHAVVFEGLRLRTNTDRRTILCIDICSIGSICAPSACDLIITVIMVMVLSSLQSNCESSPSLFGECMLNASLRTKSANFTMVSSLPVGCYHYHHFIITHLKSWFSFYHLMEREGWLSLVTAIRLY